MPNFFSTNSEKNLWVQPFEDHKNKKFGILFINLDSGVVESVPTKFSVHSLYFDRHRQELIGVNKYGPEYLRIAIVNFQRIKYFRVAPEISLSGHVASHDQASEYFFTAIANKSGENALIGLNKETGLETALYTFARTSPPVHDCRISPDKKSILATSGSALHSFAIAERKITKRELSLSTKGASLRHFAVSARGDISLQGNVIQTGENYTYESAEVVYLSENSEQRQLIAPLSQELKDAELLDFCFDLSGDYFACVHGGTGIMSLWSSRPFAHQAFLNFPEEIVRVQNMRAQQQFLVMGRKHFFLVDARNRSIEKRPNISSALSMSYSYGHRTVIAV